MQKTNSEDLTARLIAHVQQDTSDHFPNTVVESSDIYRDPVRWQQERQKLFFDSPQLIAFAGEVAQPNSFLTAECMGVPIVVTRDENSQLHAFVNACAHRGAEVASGCGQGRRLTCKFHGWSYGLDGRLLAMPEEKAFTIDKQCHGLQRLPVSDNSGLIVVGLTERVSQSAVDHFLDDIAPVLSGYGFDQALSIETRRKEVAANWKLVVSLSHESYHFATLHRKSLMPMMTAHAAIDEYGLHTRWSFPLKGIEALDQVDAAQWPSRPPAVVSHTLFPGTILIVNPRDAQIIRAEPGLTPATSVIFYTGICDDPAHREASEQSYEFGWDIFVNEDLPAAEQCQRGLTHAHKEIVLGRNEPIVQLWHQRWHQALT